MGKVTPGIVAILGYLQIRVQNRDEPVHGIVGKLGDTVFGVGGCNDVSGQVVFKGCDIDQGIGGGEEIPVGVVGEAGRVLLQLADRSRHRSQQAPGVIGHLCSVIQSIDDLDGVSVEIVVDDGGAVLGIGNRGDLVEVRIIGEGSGGTERIG